MSDLISRQAAIDALDRAEALTLAFGYHNVIDTIRELPSAQPEWIPCSERLPEEGKEVLVTVWGRCEMASYKCALDGLQEWEFNDFSLDNEDFIDVTAWMPLPEPYKEEKNERTD